MRAYVVLGKIPFGTSSKPFLAREKTKPGLKVEKKKRFKEWLPTT